MAHILGYHHLSLSVTDLDRSTTWYRQVLGLEVVADIEGAGFRRRRLRDPAEGVTLTLTCHDERSGDAFSERRTGMDHVSLQLSGPADLADMKARFERLGVEHSEVKAMGSSAAMISFRDPDNIQLEYWLG